MVRPVEVSGTLEEYEMEGHIMLYGPATSGINIPMDMSIRYHVRMKHPKKDWWHTSLVARKRSRELYNMKYR